MTGLRAVIGVSSVSETPSFNIIYGKRIIVRVAALRWARWRWGRSRRPTATTSAASAFPVD